MPTARGALAVAELDGQIYAAGGSPVDRERDFAVYDPALNIWQVLPDMPSPRNHLAAATVRGKFYAVGGRTGGIAGIKDALEVYDPMTGTWSAKTPMPTARGGIAGAGVGRFLLVFGGEGNPIPPGTFEESEAYDTSTDEWLSLAPMPTPRHGIGAAVIDDLVYIPGGGPEEGASSTTAHEVFDCRSLCRDVVCDIQMSQPEYRDGETVTASDLRIVHLGPDYSTPAECKESRHAVSGNQRGRGSGSSSPWASAPGGRASSGG